MKSIQMTAIILWGIIFIAAAFVLGQFLVSKNVFDITSIITGEDNKEETTTQIDDELANDIVINKVGQETVRVGLNMAKEYFSEYYEEYINYIMSNTDSYPTNQKVQVNDTLASEYVFYAVSASIDSDKYSSNEEDGKILITEAEVNSFADKMFEKEIDEAFKKDGKYSYNSANKNYSIEKISEHEEYVQELSKIENITSNQMVLTYECKNVSEKNSKVELENTIKLTVTYKGGRYLVSDVEKIK